MSASRLLVPEVIQTSAMDCGPACLKSLLEGFHIPVNYDRLREACQTNLDGASINTIEEIANELGLLAEQIMVPVDHVTQRAANALPGVVILRLPNSMLHFVVVWKVCGPFLQVMDPQHGRQWISAAAFLDRMHLHEHAVAGEDWREWAGSEEFLQALRMRALRLGLSPTSVSEIVNHALDWTGWRPMAALDATIRMMDPIARQGVRGDRAIRALVEQFFERAISASENPCEVIPPRYWSVLPAADYSEDKQSLIFRGAVLVRICGKKGEPAKTGGDRDVDVEGERLSLSSVLRDGPIPAVKQLVGFLRADGLLGPGVMCGALVLAAAGLVFEALLFRSFFDLTGVLGIPQQRLVAVAMLAGFLLAGMGLDLSIASGLLRFGRRLELRFRAHLLHAIPRLSDRYFASRLVSDMAERSHAIHEIRTLPVLGGQLIQYTAEFMLTVAGIIYLDWRSAPLAITALISTTLLPLLAQPLLAERDLRFRTHSGGLCRFYFDALRGLTPVLAHGAEGALRREHEGLLAVWARAGLKLQRAIVAMEGVSMITGYGLTVWLLLSHMARSSGSGVGLLFVYWALNIRVLAGAVVQTAWQYPRQRNLASRLLEPLAAPLRGDSPQPSEVADRKDAHREITSGVSVAFQNASVRALGHTILEEFSLTIPSGSHVCIVGPSGAGKSSLAGLLLGWHSPATGTILVDGLPLDQARLEALRHQTAWVDPAIQLWNRSLFDNLTYGAPLNDLTSFTQAIETADLAHLMESLPEGMQTPLGEGGAMVSGGEGQRVRFGRAIARPSSRLVVLDEPFTALDRPQRHELLQRARALWHHATLLCITHDVAESRNFERVLVMENGRVVEDGSPASLLRNPDSCYGRLLEIDDRVRNEVWPDRDWRKVRIEEGQIIETQQSRNDRVPEESFVAGGASR